MIKRYEMKVIPAFNPLVKVSHYGIPSGKWVLFDHHEKDKADALCDLKDQVTAEKLKADQWKAEALARDKVLQALGSIVCDLTNEIEDIIKDEPEKLKEFKAALAGWGENDILAERIED